MGPSSLSSFQNLTTCNLEIFAIFPYFLPQSIKTSIVRIIQECLDKMAFDSIIITTWYCVYEKWWKFRPQVVLTSEQVFPSIAIYSKATLG